MEGDGQLRAQRRPVAALLRVPAALRDAARVIEREAAVRDLRARLPVLPPPEAVAYVTALLDGDPPAHLPAVATGELVPPPRRQVETVPSGAEARERRRSEG